MTTAEQRLDQLIDELQHRISSPVARELTRMVSLGNRKQALLILTTEGLERVPALVVYNHLRAKATSDVELEELPADQWHTLSDWTGFIVRFGTTISPACMYNGMVMLPSGAMEPLKAMHQIWLIKKDM